MTTSVADEAPTLILVGFLLRARRRSGVDALDRTQARDLWEFTWPSGIGPRVGEPTLLKIDPCPLVRVPGRT